jgi:RecB family exonuclease
VVPQIVAYECRRWPIWRPAALETEFALTLGDLSVWVAAEAAALGEAAAGEPLAPAEAGIPLKGRIDRIDVATADPGLAAVLDYKTGVRPGPRAVASGKELQVVLYAVAVESGACSSGAIGGRMRVVAASYYGLRDGEVGLPASGPHLGAVAEDGRRLLLAGARELLAAARAVLAPDSTFPLVPEHLKGETREAPPCRYCAFLGICRLEEKENLPPRLADALHPRPETVGGG